MLGIHLDDVILRNLCRRPDVLPGTLLAMDLDPHLDDQQKTYHHPDDQQETSLRLDDRLATIHPVVIVLCETTPHPVVIVLHETTRHLVVLFEMIPLVVTVTIAHQLEMTLLLVGAVEIIVPVDHTIKVLLVAICHPMQKTIVDLVNGILLVVKVRLHRGGQDGIVPLLDEGMILIQRIVEVGVGVSV
jgi:hypothetical protein